MRNKTFPIIFLSLIASVFLAGKLNLDFYVLAVIGLLTMIAAILFPRGQKIFYILLGIAVFILGGLNLKQSRDFPPQHIKNISSPTAQLCFVQGHIVSNPERVKTPEEEKSRFILRLERIKYQEEWLESEGEIQVQSKTDFPYQFGQRLIMEGVISQISPPRNPAAFDYRLYLERKKIFCQLWREENMFQEIIEEPDKQHPLFWAYSLQNQAAQIFDRYFTPPYNTLFNTMILGVRSPLDDRIEDNFIKTGTMHILAISGLHVGIIIFLVIGVLCLLRVPRQPRFLITMLVLLAYVFICRQRPSVLRAVMMAEIFMLGYLLMRRISVANCLFLTAIILLAVDPEIIYDAGFQLSFLCVFAIVYLAPGIENFLNLAYAKGMRRRERTANYIKKSLVISASVFIGTWPVVAHYFYTVSWISILVNLFIIPMLFLVVGAGFLLLLAASFTPFLAGLVAKLGAFFAGIILKIAALFAHLPFSFARIPPPSLLFIIAYYLFLAAALNHERLRLSKAKIIIIGLLFANICLGLEAYHNSRPQKLKVVFFSLGDSDAICVQFPGKEALLVDTGGDYEFDPGRNIILPYLWQQGITRLNAVILTHPHYDHIGGMFGLLDNIPIDHLFENGQRSRERFYPALENVLARKKIRRYKLQRGDKILGMASAEIEVLHPDAAFMAKNYGENNNSLVLKISYGNFSMLLCGDIEKAAMERILTTTSPALLQAVVYKAPHHGKEWADDDSFEQAVSPGIIVLSQRKSYGSYPGNKRVLSTATEGAVIITTDGMGFKAEGFFTKL